MMVARSIVSYLYPRDPHHCGVIWSEALPAPLVAIVDDDPGVRGSVDSLLRSTGMVGRSFASGEELLRCDEQSTIVCIITDLNMPGMSGIELQARLAERGWSQPVILMTAFPTNTARAQAMQSGAHAFLTKPIDPDELLEAVVKAVS